MGGGNAADVLSEAEIAKLLKRVDAAAAKLEELRSSRAAAQVSVRNTQKEVGKLTTQLKRLKMVVDAADKQEAALEEAAQRARSTGSALSTAEAARAAELDTLLAGMEKKTNAQQAKVDTADAALEALQEQVLAVGGVKLRAQKGKVETLKEQMNGSQQNLTKAQVQLETSQRAVEKLEASIAKQRKTGEEQEKKNEEMRAKLESLGDEAYEVLQRYEKC